MKHGWKLSLLSCFLSSPEKKAFLYLALSLAIDDRLTGLKYPEIMR